MEESNDSITPLSTDPATPLTESQPKSGFQQRKLNCLSKRDKSSAGRIDPRAVQICHSINALEDYYTLSSCAGRCFLYRGKGIKNTNDFERFRVNHDLIRDPKRYFNLQTLPPISWESSDANKYDLTGGGDATPTRGVGQYDNKRLLAHEEHDLGNADQTQIDGECYLINDNLNNDSRLEDCSKASREIWLRFEPFILHVCCRTLLAAQALLNVARPAFKNVGLTSWKASSKQNDDEKSKYVVAIWGDEGLDMPLSTPDNSNLPVYIGMEEWLAQLVNTRHERNWEKIDKFNMCVHQMQPTAGDSSDNEDETPMEAASSKLSFDKIGDVALMHSVPEGSSKADWERIMAKNKGIKLVAARTSTLKSEFRSTGKEGITIIAGPNRSPLITTHSEHGIKCVVDLQHCFFSNRMGPERIRICQQVARGERVLVLFSGVGMEALQLAGRTEAKEIIAVEKNPVAAECARRGALILKRNKRLPCARAFERLKFIEGDVNDVLQNNEDSLFEPGSFDRILAPRPKEGNLDGDLGTGDAGVPFLELLVPLLRPDGGECHWYDFCADHEFPTCVRTRNTIEGVCKRLGRQMEVINVANAGSVAKRQFRLCMDFRIFAKTSGS